MLEDMVPVMNIEITEEDFKYYKEKIDFSLKTWD